MQTVSQPSIARKSAVISDCVGCGRPVTHPADLASISVLCQKCQRSAIANDAANVIADLQRLRLGAAPFDVLTAQERTEILAGEGPDFTTETRYPGFRALSDTILIGIISDSRPMATAPGESVGDICRAAKRELERRAENAHRIVDVSREETERKIEAEEATSGDRWDGQQ